MSDQAREVLNEASPRPPPPLSSMSGTSLACQVGIYAASAKDSFILRSFDNNCAVCNRDISSAATATGA